MVGASSLTPDQRRVVQAGAEGNLLVAGPAGSGKTILLLHRARQLLAAGRGRADRLRVLVYTRVLRKYIRSGITELGLGEDQVDCFYDWAAAYHRANVGSRLPWKPGGKGPDYQAILHQVLGHVESRRPGPVFDVLLVDEGQDLPAEAFRLFPLIAQHVTVFLDPVQRIYEADSNLSLAASALGLRHASAVLLQNLRNSPAVARAAAAFLAEPEASRYLAANAVPATSATRVPLLYLADTGRDEVGRMVEVARGEVQQGKRVGVLLSTNRMVLGMAAAFEEAGLEVEAVTAREHESADFNELTPKVLTIHSAKGLTFDSVILPRVTGDKYQWFQDAERLLFVASTRALEWVYFGTELRDMHPAIQRLFPLAERGELVIQRTGEVPRVPVTPVPPAGPGRGGFEIPL